MVKFKCSWEPSEEGLWTKLQHAFSFDSKSPAIIDDLIKGLAALKEDQKQKFLKTELDFKFIKSSLVDSALKFLNLTTQFLVANFKDIQKAEINSKESAELMGALENKFKGIKSVLDHDLDKFVLIMDDEDAAKKKGYLEEDKTYQASGYTPAKIKAVAESFKKSSAGNLKTLRDAKWDTGFKGMHEDARGYAGNFTLFYVYAKTAMKLYKKIDYFLFYTNKKVSHL